MTEGQERSRFSIGPTRNPETRSAVLKAARDVLEESGYAGFTLDAVAKRAGASKRTIYKWWGGKAGLVLEVYDEESYAQLTVPDLGSLGAELGLICRNLWRIWRETSSGAALKSLIAEAQQDAAAMRLLVDELLPRRMQFPRAAFDRAKERGELPADYDPMPAIGLLNAFNWFRLLTDRLDDESAIDAAVAMITVPAAGPRSAPAG